MAKTLTDFRAEKGLYLKDLATALEMTEDELRAIEESGTVPVELGQRIIAQYALPADYFAEPVKIPKKTNSKRKLPYLFGTSLVWFFITSLVLALPTQVLTIFGSLVAVSSFLSTDNPFMDMLNHPDFEVFNDIYSVVIVILAGVLFARYILKNTHYVGDVKKYQFLYYILPASTMTFLNSIWGTVILKMYDNMTPSAIFISGIISIAVSVIMCLLFAFVCSMLINAAIEEDESKKKSILTKIAIATTVSSLISLVVYFLNSQSTELVYIVINILSFALTIAIAWLVAFIKPKNKAIEKIIYTILPLISICDTLIFTIAELF